MYTPLEEAKKEVWKRWNDADLRRRVQEHMGEVPEVLFVEPKAVVFRQLATPNFEFLRFQKMAANAGLKTICTEFTSDKFCSKNPDKLFLGKVFFFNGKGKHNGDKLNLHHVIDFCTMDGKPLQNVRTVWGVSFVDFHHQMLLSELPDMGLIEITTWLQEMGSRPELFYYRYLSLFICHGIMFENFLDEGDEGKFTREIVRPAIRRITEHFGLKPLIVRLLPEESEADPYWCWYPGHLEAEVKVLMAGGETAARLHAAEGSTTGLALNCIPLWK